MPLFTTAFQYKWIEIRPNRCNGEVYCMVGVSSLSHFGQPEHKYSITFTPKLLTFILEPKAGSIIPTVPETTNEIIERLRRTLQLGATCCDDDDEMRSLSVRSHQMYVSFTHLSFATFWSSVQVVAMADLLASSDKKSASRPQGPAPKISTKQIVFALSARQKQSEARFSISSSVGDPYYAYKVKTTAPKRFCVRPNQGTIAPGQTVDVTVSFMHDKILQETQSQAFNFNLIAQTMLKDKFLVQTVALNQGEPEYPSEQATQLMHDAHVLDQQGNKAQADVAKSKADEVQHKHWESFKDAKRVVDSKISLQFVEASRASSISEDDGGAKSMHSATRANSNASPHDAGGGNSVSKATQPGLGRVSSAAGDDGVTADLLAENSRLRCQLEGQKEVLAQTTEALEALRAQLDIRSRKSLESMSEADVARAASNVSGTVYDKKTETQLRSPTPITVQVVMNAHPRFVRFCARCCAYMRVFV